MIAGVTDPASQIGNRPRAVQTADVDQPSDTERSDPAEPAPTCPLGSAAHEYSSSAPAHSVPYGQTPAADKTRGDVTDRGRPYIRGG